MTSWLRRTQAGIVSAPVSAVPTNSAKPQSSGSARLRDPNAPDIRLDVEQKCIYERPLPGGGCITAHLRRLQSGFYDSPSTHGATIENVRFLAIYFVFHPVENINRFRGAIIKIALHDDTDQKYTDPHAGRKRETRVPKNKPKFLRFAPHLLYGGVSPETLDWNFNLSGSIGVSQMPVSASVSPSGGFKTSYKVYEMMRIQGSTRTLQRWHEHEYDIEDGEVYWTLEENPLQKSGLPREMTFVMLITKGDVDNVVFDIDIVPRIGAWFGQYPEWYCNLPKYQPLSKEAVDLDKQLGQVFEPTVPNRGFNFANLAGTFNDYVSLPGTTLSTSDQSPTAQATGDPAQAKPAGPGDNAAAPPSHNPDHAQAKQQPQMMLPQSLDINVYIKPDHSTIFKSPTPDHMRRTGHQQTLPKKRSIDIAYKPRQNSLRRSRSRSDLKEESELQENSSPLLVSNGLNLNRNRFSYPAYLHQNGS